MTYYDRYVILGKEWVNSTLIHHGVLGMKWGVVKSRIKDLIKDNSGSIKITRVTKKASHFKPLKNQLYKGEFNRVISDFKLHCSKEMWNNDTIVKAHGNFIYTVDTKRECIIHRKRIPDSITKLYERDDSNGK